jgi:hypothetical protein
MILMLRQSLAAASYDQHEDFPGGLTLSLSKGEERRAERESKSGGLAKATNAESLGERLDEAAP